METMPEEIKVERGGKRRIDKAELKAELKRKREKDNEMVTGIFHFHEVPGSTMKFVFRAYKEDDVQIYELTDNQICKIPLGVARHLNKDCWYPIHKNQIDDNGIPMQVIGKKVHRCSFQSLEFVDPTELPQINDVVTNVETISYKM